MISATAKSVIKVWTEVHITVRLAPISFWNNVSAQMSAQRRQKDHFLIQF